MNERTRGPGRPVIVAPNGILEILALTRATNELFWKLGTWERKTTVSDPTLLVYHLERLTERLAPLQSSPEAQRAGEAPWHVAREQHGSPQRPHAAAGSPSALEIQAQLTDALSKLLTHLGALERSELLLEPHQLIERVERLLEDPAPTRSSPKAEHAGEVAWLRACADQGWDEHSRLAVVLDLLRERGLMADLGEHARRVAAEKNYMARACDIGDAPPPATPQPEVRA